jgi:mannose-6-phosphate isomerase-like protein (cupin superfamily)
MGKILTGIWPDAAPVLARLDGAPRVKSYGDTAMHVLVPSESVGGAYGIWDSICQPGFGPPRHVHHREDEIFQVMEGRLLIWCNGETYEADAGGFVCLPRGVPHSFRVVSATPARIITTVVPGGFERFFAAIAGLSMPADMNRAREIGQEFSMDFVGPPLEG